ncbi:MAG: M14 family zinc carboxypeptidase [candidate division KSB1 bacterium]|nr:M14 family zinc carboxypeptidase [candidate division KSB1 bacterium]
MVRRIALVLVLLAGVGAYAQPRLPLATQTPPRGTSHLEMMAFLTALAESCPWLELEVVGRSVEGREVPAVYMPPRENWCPEGATVMVFAQQHGDEPSGKEALLMLVHELCTGASPRAYAHLNLILVPMVNPDGNEAHTRRNSRHVDLNRNHAILTEPETRILRSLFNRHAPHVTLDVHEYSIRSWIAHGLIKDLGEQFDCISNPAIPPLLLDFARERLLWPTIQNARACGLKANRYLVAQDDPRQPVRHSTTDIDDGRNGFGIDCTLSFILEGPNGLSPEDGIWERAKYQLAFIERFLAVCDSAHADIVRVVGHARAERRAQLPAQVPIQADYTAASSCSLQVTIRSTRTLRDTTIVLSDYRNAPEVLRAVPPPAAYLVERPPEVLLTMVSAHGFPYETLDRKLRLTVEEFRTTGVDTLRCEGRTTVVPAGHYRRAKKTFASGCLLLPVTGVSAAKLVQLMEPQSLYGLSHYEEFAQLYRGQTLPVHRVLSAKW